MSCDPVITTSDLAALAVPGVRALRPYEPGKPISELERDYGVRDAVKLASNENPLGPSPRALEAARNCLAELLRYPDGNGFELKAALARHHGIAAECITLGNGSNDVLDLIARAFLAPGHEAVFSEHAFAVYPIVTCAVGAQARVAKAAPGYGHDLEAMHALVGECTRVVFVANPNNPTGTWLHAGALEAFVASLPQHTVVVVDEAYFEYVAEPEYPDTSTWIGRYPNLIVTRTFSKAHGLAGLRVGYSLSHPDVADLLNRVRQPFNVNSIAQAAAAAALADSGHVARTVALNRAGLEQLEAGLHRLGLAFIPSVGNFLCVDVGGPAGPAYEALLREGVIVRPIGAYGLPNHLRVTVGTADENERFLGALGRVAAPRQRNERTT
jgi:histidinol-phosphate aminotransferase